MNLLVPLPFDVSNLAHGRNLRIVNLLRALKPHCRITCLVADESTAGSGRDLLSDVRFVWTGRRHDSVNPQPAAFSTWGASFGVRRALSFLGYDASLVSATRQYMHQADAVLGFDMPSVAYLLAARNRTHTPGAPRIVCDLIDDPRLLRKSYPLRRRCSAAGLKAAISIRAILKHVLGSFDALVAVAPRDAESLSRATGLNTAVVPNGVNIATEETVMSAREPLVVFTGAMDFPPNEAAARYLVRRIWPQVRTHFKRSVKTATGKAFRPTLALVGVNPSRMVKQLANGHDVIVTGRVPDMMAWLTRASVATAPMINGCGIKNKILEACAAGCPVVSTATGVAGLPIGQQNGIVVANTPDDFSDTIIRLLSHPEQVARMGMAGRSMVQDRFSWTRSAQTLMRILAPGSTATRVPNHEQEFATTEEVFLANQHQPYEEALTHAAS